MPDLAHALGAHAEAAAQLAEGVLVPVKAVAGADDRCPVLAEFAQRPRELVDLGVQPNLVLTVFRARIGARVVDSVAELVDELGEP